VIICSRDFILRAGAVHHTVNYKARSGKQILLTGDILNVLLESA